jgi:FkbM family methyltransferase
MSKIKKLTKAFLWWIFPKKNGISSLKVLNGPAKGSILNLDVRLESSYWFGNYDKWIFDSIPFEDYIKPGNVVWDGGAYVGYYTAYFRKLVGAAGKVHSFEASGTNYARLKDLPANNKWNNVFIHNIAIGPDHSEISFVDNLGGSNGPYGLDKVYHESSENLNINKVVCCGVDELIDERNIAEPDFIKFDLESAEEFALHNGDKLFKGKRPVILLELHGKKTKESAGLFLEKYNYEGVFIEGFRKKEVVVRSQKEFNDFDGIPHMIVCLPL